MILALELLALLATVLLAIIWKIYPNRHVQPWLALTGAVTLGIAIYRRFTTKPTGMGGRGGNAKVLGDGVAIGGRGGGGGVPGAASGGAGGDAKVRGGGLAIGGEGGEASQADRGGRGGDAGGGGGRGGHGGRNAG